MASTKVEEAIVKRTVILLIAVLSLFSCKGKTEVAAPAANAPASAALIPPPITASNMATATLPPGHPNIAPPPQSAGSNLSGTVAETMNAGGYTYINLKTANGSEWVAVPQATIKKGANVSIAVQMTMEKFESKTLKRTFDHILFGTVVNGEIAAAPASAMPTMPAMPPGHPPMTSASSASSADDANVPRAEGGKTVSEVWAGKSSLKDTQVVVRGKVVKFLPAIMGKNWLHLRDGSGSGKNGDNDLTVTTSDAAKVGDVITIKGTVHTDKDFGAGYSYVVIVEDASIVK